jgi:hypothetical protein
VRHDRGVRDGLLIRSYVCLHPNYIGDVECGQRNVGVVNLTRIAVALGLDPGELARGLR